MNVDIYFSQSWFVFIPAVSEPSEMVKVFFPEIKLFKQNYTLMPSVGMTEKTVNRIIKEISEYGYAYCKGIKINFKD